MYIPEAFRVEDQTAVDDLMRRYGWGLLVTVDEAGVPLASHLPLLFEPATSGTGRGCVAGHLAFPNPQVDHLRAKRPALAVFWGPHAYISPRWYVTPGRVPTWNYVTVHASGVARVSDDPAAVRTHLNRLASTYEGAAGWSTDELHAEVFEGLTRAIVAFEIDLDHAEGKAKLNQNHPMENITGAATALEAGGGDDQVAIAALMREAARRR